MSDHHDIAAEMGLGATGQFPEGKRTPDDEGELKTAIYVEKGQVVLNFGKEVSWLSLPAQDAANLASVLIKKAREAAAQYHQTIVLDIR